MRCLVLFLWCLAAPVWAVHPGEVLDDPELEARARGISAELRCLVCRNESIDQSNADLARDLRLLVRERLIAGDTDAQVMDYVVARYGEYVLLRPNARGANLVLWLAGPLMLLVGGISGAVFLWGRARAGIDAPEDTLSKEDQARLDRILQDGAGRLGLSSARQMQAGWTQTRQKEECDERLSNHSA